MIAQFESLGKAEAAFGKAQAAFKDMIDFVKKAAESNDLRIDEVERALFTKTLAANLHLLEAFAARAGDGDHGETIEREGKTLVRSEKKTKFYRSIFGVLAIERYVYSRGAKRKTEWAPVDARLGLPVGEQSYVLEDWMVRLCVKESFAEGVGTLSDLLGLKTSVRAAEVMARHMADHTETFQEIKTSVDPEREQEILVFVADGKGVPMRRPLEQRLREEKAATAALDDACQNTAQPTEACKSKRLKPGEKRTRKQMAYVGAVYSIAPFKRNAADVVDELRRKKRQPDRPRPQNKQVLAEMTRFREGEVINGQVRCFARLAWSAIFRMSLATTLVCLMDGQRSLWALKESWFGKAVGILDIFHVLERLWQVAHAFHGDGSDAAKLQVDRHLRMLLEGKVSCVIGLYRRMLSEYGLKGGQAKTVRENIAYFENNKRYMKYDDYLSAGYPIGTGVAEGACHHLVKDRMELSGMRWEIEGAQAILSLRALHLNDQWDDFIAHRIQREQETLYAQAA
ncbi:MAG: ISKra4 family transposase [Bryobacteraceae bacterium]